MPTQKLKIIMKQALSPHILCDGQIRKHDPYSGDSLAEGVWVKLGKASRHFDLEPGDYQFRFDLTAGENNGKYALAAFNVSKNQELEPKEFDSSAAPYDLCLRFTVEDS